MPPTCLDGRQGHQDTKIIIFIYSNIKNLLRDFVPLPAVQAGWWPKIDFSPGL